MACSVGSDGDGPAQIKAGNSAFEKTLRSAAVAKRFVYLFVSDDSLQAFNEAARLAQSLKYELGWFPAPRNSKLSYVLWSTNPNDVGIKVVPQ